MLASVARASRDIDKVDSQQSSNRAKIPQPKTIHWRISPPDLNQTASLLSFGFRGASVNAFSAKDANVSAAQFIQSSTARCASF